MDEIVETGINWDHDTGEIVISTRKKSVATKLRKLGLTPTKDEGPTGYVTFKAKEDKVRLRFSGPKSESRKAAGRRAAERMREGSRGVKS